MTGYTASSLIKTYRYLKAHPDEVYLFGEWPGEAMNWAQWREWFRGCLNAKINRDDKPRGKDDTPEYRQDLDHDVRFIREYVTTRIRHIGSGLLRTPEARARYPNINCQPFEL